jgi:hypothetical protein
MRNIGFGAYGMSEYGFGGMEPIQKAFPDTSKKFKLTGAQIDTKYSLAECDPFKKPYPCIDDPTDETITDRSWTGATPVTHNGKVVYIPPGGMPKRTAEPVAKKEVKEETPLYMNPLVIIGVLAAGVVVYMIATRPPM